MLAGKFKLLNKSERLRDYPFKRFRESKVHQSKDTSLKSVLSFLYLTVQWLSYSFSKNIES